MLGKRVSYIIRSNDLSEADASMTTVRFFKSEQIKNRFTLVYSNIDILRTRTLDLMSDTSNHGVN